MVRISFVVFGVCGLLVMLDAECGLAQGILPSLAELKVAADAGDPVAQDKMGERDSANAEAWYRKAAEQGFAHAQGKLGYRLLLRSRTSPGLSPAARSAMTDEAVRWITCAAYQGDKRGQADFSDICLEGKLVKQDLIEAYKWGELAARGSIIDTATISGQWNRDAAVLKMNAEQIAEGRKRVAEFVPHRPAKSELPEPAWVKQIKLNGISGTSARRLAIINNETFQIGDQSVIKAGQQKANVRCLEIRDSSVIISIEGIEGKRELRL
jgi:hypothetical protein